MRARSWSSENFSNSGSKALILATRAWYLAISRAFESNILFRNATIIKGSPRIVQQTCYGLDDAGHPAEAGRSSSTVVYHSPHTKSNGNAFRTRPSGT